MTQTTQQKRPPDLLRRAMSLHESGNLQEAGSLYAQYLQDNPQDLQASRLFAALMREAGDFDSSLALLFALTESHPAHAPGFNELAITCMAAGRLDDAEDALTRALELEADNADALINLGALLQFRGHASAAADCYRTALEQTPEDIDVQCNLAKALADAGRAEEALTIVEAALDASEQHPYVASIKATILADNGNHADAATLLEQAATAMPDDDTTLINLGYSYQHLKRFEDACATWRKAVTVNPRNARAVSDLAYALIQRGEADTAVKLCDGFLLRHPGEPMVVAAYSYACIAAGVDSKTLFDFDALLTTHTVEPPAGFASLENFNAALKDALISDDSLTGNPQNKSTYGGSQTGELRADSNEALAAFAGLIKQHVAVVAEHWQKTLPNHPALARQCDDYQLRAWGTVLESDGHQAPHIHPLSWVSGVYYAAVPEEINGDQPAGWIEFGAPPERHAIDSILASAANYTTHRLQPAEGLLVLFPSYLHHRTLPFSAETQRISIAFDAVPFDAASLF